MFRSSQESGFTLIEMLIILTLLAIFAAIAIPNMSQLINSNRSQSAAEELLAQLQFARSEAVVRSRTVTVENLGNQGQWNGALRIYVSNNQVPNRAYNASQDTELRDHEGMLHTSLSATGDSNAQKWLSFRANGSLAIPRAATIIVCAENDPRYARAINLEPSGRVSMPATQPNSCTP